MKNLEKPYLLATNDETGRTMVIVPNRTNELRADEAMVIANRHFKRKVSNLHVAAGVRKGNKVESVDDLNETGNCWMVWR